MPQREPQLQGPDAFLDALRPDAAETIRSRWRDDPLGLAEHLGLLLPKKPVQVMQELGIYDPEQHGPIVPGLRDLVEDVCTLEVRSAVAVGPRGGGKSQGVSYIEFFLWMIREFDALNLGGSELQANNVYEYLLAYIAWEPEFEQMLMGPPTRSETHLLTKSWIRVLTASQKSVRSPHAGGWRTVNGQRIERGGLLVIDEEAEADPDIVGAALPTINTARPSVNVRCSTFHNEGGSFAEVVDNAKDMGYKTYRWDIFDVCERCDCIDVCQSPEPCFREDHTEDFIDPDNGELKKRLIHKAYCGGRAMYASGWIPMSEILTLWRRMMRNHSTWEVEAMGSRPGSSGHVIKDQFKFDNNFAEERGEQLYIPGFPIDITVDWGAVKAGVTVWQYQHPNKHVLLHADEISDAGLTEILGIIIGYWIRYPEAQEVACDIGGGGNYLNPHLREEEGLPVRDCNFAEMKESAAAVWNIFNETNLLVYPSDAEVFKHQGKNWKRANGRIQKGNDHLMDASLCYFAKFAEELGVNHLRVAPKSFTTNDVPPERGSARDQAPSQGMRPLVRPIAIRH